jgi:hypothetical protein
MSGVKQMTARTRTSVSLVAMGLVAALTGTLVVHAQQPPAPPSASQAKAKALAAALAAKKFEYYAVSDPAMTGRYVAVLHVPGVQMLVISATYERITDMDYRFYQKDYQNVYLDLRSGLLSKDRVIVEDTGADGLVAVPGKSLAQDTFGTGPERKVFDGDFADPKKKNQKKISQDEYMKAFTAADEQYTKLLGILIDGLGKI